MENIHLAGADGLLKNLILSREICHNSVNPADPPGWNGGYPDPHQFPPYL